VDYGEILSTSFNVGWRHKSLWIFGLFASGFALPLNNFKDDFDFSTDRFDFENFEFADMVPWIVLGVGLVVLLAIIVSLICHSISTPALVDAVNRITRGGQYRFRTSLSTGIKYMWRTLALLLLHFLTHAVFWLFVVLLTVAFFAIAVPLGVLGIVFGLPIAIVFTFVVLTTFSLAFRALVVRDATVTDALAEGFDLLRRNKMSCLVIAVINFVLGVVTFLAVMLVVVVLVIPFLAISALSDAGLAVSLLVGIPLFWLVTLPISGYLGAVFEAIYTIFYFRLYEPTPATSTAPMPGGPTG